MGLLVGAAVCGVIAAPAVAAKRDLWATVNVCDSAHSPDVLGVRGQMPGTGHTGGMYMRFRLEYWSVDAKAWRPMRGRSSDSGYIAAGSSRYARRQTGASFAFHPASGESYRLRGVVDYEWRERGEVRKRARRRTSSGHRSAAGADPPGFSAGACTIRP